MINMGLYRIPQEPLDEDIHSEINRNALYGKSGGKMNILHKNKSKGYPIKQSINAIKDSITSKKKDSRFWEFSSGRNGKV